MPSPKKKSLPTAPGSTVQNFGDATLERDKHDDDERVIARKADMLQRRQADLDLLTDRHDDLVREAFQLDKFVTLLSYDPKVAKHDNSQVFLEYKASHDLLSKTAAASGSGQNTRKTRRATTEFRESLAATISAGPSTLSVPPTTPPKSKGKPGVVSRQVSVSPLGKNVGRAKMQAKDIPFAGSPSGTKGKGKAKELHTSPSSLITETMPPPHTRRDHHPRRVKDDLARKTPEGSEQSAAPSIAGSRSMIRMGASSSSSQPPPNRLERTRKSLRDLKKDPTPVNAELSERPEQSVPHAPPKLPIKRIRLFQRPRPAVYTHPSQLPPRPLHNNSIVEFLKSFTSLEDGIDMTRDELERIVSTEAKTRARIRDLRQQGRLLLDIPELPDGSIGFSSLATPDDGQTPEVTRNEDHYDHLVSAASRRGLLVAAEYATRRSMAKKVAKLVMGWHGNKESTEEKQRKAEAVRIKTLAKLTIKEVEKQWKKAVLAVRDHNRAIFEAEEARRGQKHLDAILDQSGAILEAQHTDLSRARSRSSSARDWSDSGESDGGLEEDGGGSEDDAGSRYSDADTGEDDANVAWLLGTDVVNQLSSRGSTSDLENGSVLDTDEIRSHGLYSRETPPSRSDISMDVSLSRTPSEVTLEVRPSTSAGTVPSTPSVVDTLPGPASGNDETPRGDDISKKPLIVRTDNDLTAGLSDPDYFTTSYPRRKGYRSSSPGSPFPQDRGISITPSPSSPIHSRSSPQPNISPNTIQTNDYRTPLNENGDSRLGLNGHKAVAVRLSNGVVIYRDIDTSSSPGESSSAVSLTAASKGNGKLEHSQGDMNSEVLVPTVEVTRQRSPQITIGNQESGQPATDFPLELGGPEPTASTGTTPTAKNVDDLIPPESSVIADHPGVNGTENQNLDVKADDQAPPPPATPSDATGTEDLAVDEPQLAPHLVDFAAAPVKWDPTSKVNVPFLLRGTLRPYQQSGLEWLASLHMNSLNGILADEMGLGKTIQTISLLAHLACDRGIWGPHLIVVPTSVLLNWEMEFKKFLPGFKILSYHGSTKRRKELRVGWNNKHYFNRKSWYYLILDEAHMIKNFKSQRWNILLMFRSFRRLLLTGTPLQNNLTELWALLQFLMSGTNFANLKEFGDWFSNPLEKAIEQGTVLDEETQERVRKLHTVLRPYLLRRLKADVEKELPSKYEHLVMCRLSKRQRFLYDEFMSRAHTRDALASGVYHKVANILMQLRKVCNHPDLFEVRPIVTSFAIPRSATIDFEIKELLVRRRLLRSQEDHLNLDFLGLVFVQHQGKSMMQARSTRALDASSCLPFITELPGEPPPVDTRTIEGFKRHLKHQRQLAALRQWTQIAYINRLRCAASPVYGSETISVIRSLDTPLVPLSAADLHHPDHLDRSGIAPTLIKSYQEREEDMADIIDRFAFVTPPAIARDMPSIALSGFEPDIFCAQQVTPEIDTILHRASVKLQIAFPDASLIQYDCGKLQELASLLHKRKAGGHRVLIFTQMTKVLDILEIFLNFHGYRYLRLDGATKIEDRQYITERFNNDDRVFAFIASSRSGGVGINLTGADTVVFYDSDFNPQMDRQCEDRAHRIGQIRDVHIYRFISEHTVEESMLRKANQKRSLDNIVIQQGEFDWRSLLIDDEAFGKALGEFEDKEDAHAARVAAREEAVKEVEDHVDFSGEADDVVATEALQADISLAPAPDEEEEQEEEGTIADYMLAFVKRDWEFFSLWR